MLITWSIIGASIIGLEIMNYLYYRKVLTVASDKKNFELSEHAHKDHQWMENYMLEKLSKDELKEWMKNTINYNNNTQDLTLVNKNNQIIKSYYNNVPFEKIPKNKIVKWLGYQMYFQSYKKLDDPQKQNAWRILELIEDKLGFKFDDYVAKDMYFLKFGSNKLETVYRPLIVYSSMNLIKNCSYVYLSYNGFTKHTTRNSKMVYFYYKKHPNKERNTTIFIHGLGFGFAPYLNFILKLVEEVDLIVPVLPNISNMEYHGIFESITADKLFPNYNILRDDFKGILIKHNVSKVNIIGHSFGTIITSVLLKDKWIKQKLAKKILIDPVCFVDESYKIFKYINQPDPRDGSILTKSINILIYNDLYVRYATQRFLFGPEYWIFDYNELKGDDTLVILSNEDQIVPSNKLYKTLLEHNIMCILVNDAEHADIFSSNVYNDVTNKIIKNIAYHVKNNKYETRNKNDIFINAFGKRYEKIEKKTY